MSKCSFNSEISLMYGRSIKCNTCGKTAEQARSSGTAECKVAAAKAITLYSDRGHRQGFQRDGSLTRRD